MARPVLVVEDHAPTLRAMVREVRGDLRPIACQTVAGARRALDALSTSPAGVIVDVRLPDGSGLDLLREIRLRYPMIRALVLTGRLDRDVINASHMLAAEFATKPDNLDNLRAFLERVAAPPPPLTDTIATFVSLYALTPRQAEVLTVLALGETRAGLARRLRVCEYTAKSHVKHILRKTGDADVGELIARLLRAAAGEFAPRYEWPTL